MRTKVPQGRVLTGSAFTLIEILIVVGIIVILLGILMPVVSQLRNQAHKATTMTLISELLEAFTTYSNEDPRRLFRRRAPMAPSAGTSPIRPPAARSCPSISRPRRARSTAIPAAPPTRA